MTPKEKAKYLLDKYFDVVYVYARSISKNELSAKECALIAVDELIKEQEVWRKAVSQNTGGTEESTYWQQVKTEIENL